MQISRTATNDLGYYCQLVGVVSIRAKGTLWFNRAFDFNVGLTCDHCTDGTASHHQDSKVFHFDTRKGQTGMADNA